MNLNLKFNKNLLVYNTRHLLTTLKINNYKQIMLKDDLIKYLNCPNELLNIGYIKRKFYRSNIENEFESQMFKNKSITKEDCIKETIKLFKNTKGSTIFNFESNLRTKKDLNLEVTLKVNFAAPIDVYVKHYIQELNKIKSNKIGRFSQFSDKYKFIILDNIKFNFVFSNNVKNKHVFINKMNRLSSQYEQILYFHMLLMKDKIKLI